jgi:MoaA/NifB/PqqE/SkfB family radical SAM enzyme
MSARQDSQVSYYKRERIDLAASLPLPRPLHIQIEPTNACNMKCFFCPVSFKDYVEQADGLYHLSMEDYKRVLGQVEEMGHLSLLSFFMIGEPFVNKHTIEFIRMAHERGVADKYQTTTNASLVTEKTWGPLCESGLDLMRCSIMGTDEQKHHERSNCNIPLSKVVENIAGLKKFRDTHGFKKPHLTLRTFTTTPEEAEQFKRDFGDVGDEAFVDFLFDWNGCTGKDEQGRGKLSRLTDEEMYKQVQFFGSHDKHVCPYPFFTLIVLPDLKVTICSTDWNHLNTVGDLRKQTLSEVWAGEPLREFQRMHLQHRRSELPACRNCSFIHNSRDNIDVVTEAILGESRRLASWSPVK